MQQSNSLDFKLVQRVCLLQQALDQALESLDELTAQVQDKYWVETQLASTEKYANVQQQAITHLKQQLAQFTEIQDHLLGVMSYRLNELIDQQQQAFDHLNLQFQQSHTELQSYLRYLSQQQASPLPERGSQDHYLVLEAEVMVARSMAVHLTQYLGSAKQHLDHLNADLGNHHLNLGHMIKTIQAMIADLVTFDQAQASIQLPQSESDGGANGSSAGRSPTAALNTETFEAEVPDVGALQADIRRQNARIQELQAALAERLHHETHLRQRYQEVAAERDHYRRECKKLQQTEKSAMVDPLLLSAADACSSPDPTDPSVPQRLRSRPPSCPIQPLRFPDEQSK